MTYHTILKLADHALSKIVRYVILSSLRPELDGQDPFQISGLLCQTRKTPTLEGAFVEWQRDIPYGPRNVSTILPCSGRYSGQRQTLEGYISKDIYIPYPIQKSRKRIYPYPFFEWDMLKDIYPYFRDLHIFISYPILYPFFSTNLNFAAFFFLLHNVVFVYTCCGEFSFG
jgi:hypothetical protein